MAKDAAQAAAEADRIKELRERKRATQPEVADAIGISLRGYQAWEAGHSTPNGQNLKALAEYHETTPDYIEYGEGRARGAAPDLFGSHGAEEDVRVIRKLLEMMAGDAMTQAALKALEQADQRDGETGREEAA